MLRPLILLAVGFLLATPPMLSAQTPMAAKAKFPVKPEAPKPGQSPDAACNEAGTFTLGAFTGQSNDHDLTTPQDIIFLCLGDQIFIDHNGDFDLSGDPDPATPPGVSYAFYNCKPTIGGMTLANIISDPCVNTTGGPGLGIWINPPLTAAEAQGDQLFKNSGQLQAIFANPDPILQWFAPITVDDWQALAYEGGPPAGPCVDASPQVAFPVVYLNEIKVDKINTFGVGGCLGRFRAKGGYSEYADLNSATKSVYTLSFSGPGTVTIDTKLTDIRHGGLDPELMFDTPGMYNITVEDAKSCGKTFTMDMTGCDPSNNITLITPNKTLQVGETLCIPITANNFKNAINLQGTLNWCAQNFQFVSVSDGVLPSADVFYNQSDIANGNLGFAWFDQNGNPYTFPDGDTLFSLCLKAIGPVGECCKLGFTNSLSKIQAGDQNFSQYAINLDEGNICIGQPNLLADVTILSNCTSAGSFQVVVNSGTPNYMMTYDGGSGPVMVDFASTYTVSNLTPGTYQIHIEDANGVSKDTSITIYSLAVNLSFTDVTCFGGTDGTATVQVTPAGTYDYAWSPAAPNVPMLTGLKKGSYSVVVTHPASGCTAQASGSLNGPAAIQKTGLTKTDATCTGVANGTVTFNVTGGNPGGYTISFDNGLGTSSTVPYVNNAIAAGVYHMTITDSKGCSKIDSIEIFATKEYELAIAKTDVACNGQNTGAISATLTTNPGTPTAPLNFVWSKGTISTTGATSTSSGLTAGPIFCTVTDATGCGVVLKDTIHEPAAKLVAAITKTDPTCAGPNSGSGNANGTTGGTLPYAFKWDFNGTLIPNPNNLGPGTLCVTVTDGNGCTATDCKTLTIPALPTITKVDSVSLNCWNSTNGSLKVTALPAVPNNTLSYAWSCSTSTTSAASGLSCGPCNVTVTEDQTGCKTTATYTLGCPPELKLVDTTITSPSCPTEDDGSVCVVVGGGTPNYPYTWQGFPTATTDCLTAKTAGTYNLTVKDAKGCSILASFVIKDPQGIQATFTGLKGTSCAGTTNCDGAVMVAASYPNGTPATFTYHWKEANIFGQNPTTLCAGVNTVEITDNATGCKIEQSVTITAPPPLVLTVLPLPTSCNGTCDGSAIATVSGGTPQYTITWSNGQTGPNATNLCAGPVVVSVTDSKGCETNLNPIVPEPAPVSVGFDPAASSNVLCFGGNDGRLGFIAAGGTGGFTWQWSPPVGNNQVEINLSAGQYAVTATDANGCTGTATANVQENPPITASFDTYVPIKCFGETTNLSVDTVTGGTGPYTYEIDYGPTTPSGIDTRIEGGDHIAIFADSLDCRDTLFFTIDQPAAIEVNLGPDLTIELGDTTKQIFPQFNIQVDSFVWFPTVGLDSSSDLRPFIKSVESQLYTLTIFDANGCSGSDDLYVQIDPHRKVFIPNIFKPGSLLSDHFRVFVGNGVESVNYMRVYDRWGELMFNQENPGVYVYMVEVSFLDGRTFLYRGDVTLVRDKE